MYSKDRLKQMLRNYHKNPTSKDIRESNIFPSLDVFLRAFGTLNKAKKQAGLKVKTQEYNKKELLEKLKEADKKYEGITVPKINQDDSFPTAATYANHFESWNKAKKQAGLKVNQKRYTDEELLEKLHEMKKEKGDISPQYLQGKKYPARSTYGRRFGSFLDAVQKAGLEDNLKENEKHYTKDIIIKKLKQYQEKIDRPIKVKDITSAKHDLPSLSTIRKYFGTLNKAKKQAGLEITVIKKYTNEELIKKLGKAIEETSTNLRHHLQTNSEYPAPSTYRRRFGTLTKAIQKTGKEYHPHKYTDQELLDKLKELKKETGKITTTALDKHDEYPSTTVYYTRFGSFTKAKKQAEEQP